MILDLPFGDNNLKLEIPKSWDLFVPNLPNLEDISPQKKNEIDIVPESLKKPIGSTKISHMDLKNKKILIVIDDNTRPTPVYKFFHIVLNELKIAGAKEKDITLMPALGIHTPMTEMEIKEKIGQENIKKIKWKNPAPYNKEENIYLGHTSQKIRVELNKELINADFIVGIGMIEPHLWAGFGGGMKLFFPGMASATSISQHHMIIANPPYMVNRVGMEPEKNSFRLQLEEVYNILNKKIFIINVILNWDKRIIHCVSGDPIRAHRKGALICKEFSGIEIPHKFHGAIINSNPMNINLKQGMKGVANSIPAVLQNGVIMGFLYAQKGIDDITLPEKSIPLPILRCLLKIMGKKRIWKFLQKVVANKSPEEKFLTYYTLHLIHDYRLVMHVPKISKKETKKLGIFENYYNPQEVIQKGAKYLPKHAKVVIFDMAGATYPYLKSGNIL